MDIRFLPYNKRSCNEIHEIAKTRWQSGGQIFTDCSKAYPKVAEWLGMDHFTVNHSVTFKDPETGVHTNTVEGVQGTLKKQSRQQISRLPSVNKDGIPYYLI